jgi:hypothetical protein
METAAAEDGRRTAAAGVEATRSVNPPFASNLETGL